MSTNNTSETDPTHDDSANDRPSLALTRSFIVENLKSSEGAIRTALAAAKRLGDPVELARCWLLYGFFYRVLQKNPKALRCLKTALSLVGGMSGNEGLQSEIETEIGAVYHNSGRPRYALEWHRRAIESARTSGRDSLTADILMSMGVTYRVLGEFELALDKLLQASHLYKDCGARYNAITAYLMVGGVYGMLEDFEKSGKISMECLASYEELGYRPGVAEALIALGHHYLVVGEYQRALIYYRRSLTVWREIGLEHNCIRVLRSIGDVYMKLASYDMALDTYHEVLEKLKDEPDPMREVSTVMGIAEVALYQRRFVECIELCERVLETIEDHELREFHPGVHHLIADAYDALGDGEASLRHLRSYLRIREELLGYDVRRKVHELQSRVDAERAMSTTIADNGRARELEEEVERTRGELAALSLQVIYQQDLIREIRESLQEAVGEKGLPNLSEIRRRIDVQADLGGGWEAFERRLRETSPTFVETLSRRYRLTPAELRVCSLLRLNLTSKEIAVMISIEPRSVDVYRLRIRKKLGLDRETNLATFLLGL